MLKAIHAEKHEEAAQQKVVAVVGKLLTLKLERAAKVVEAGIPGNPAVLRVSK